MPKTYSMKKSNHYIHWWSMQWGYWLFLLLVPRGSPQWDGRNSSWEPGQEAERFHPDDFYKLPPPKGSNNNPLPPLPRDHVFNYVSLWGTFLLQNTTMSSQTSVPGGSAGEVTCCQGWWPKVNAQSPHCGRRPPQACHGMPMPTHTYIHE